MNQDRMPVKTIYLLIGPKGSGKSFIGHLFETHYGIMFLRVEEWAKSTRRDRSIDDEEYITEVFQVIGDGVIRAMRSNDAVVFESTGLTRHFDAMLSRLQREFTVVPIRVHADPDVCLQRVRTRDGSIHIDVSDAQVMEINKQVLAKNLSYRESIDNTSKSIPELIAAIGRIVDRHQ